MTQTEATQILAILKASYPQFYKDMKKKDAIGTVNVWAVQFADMPSDIVLIAVNKLISISQFPPAISEVKKKLRDVYWEAHEALNCHEISKHLTEEQVRYYKYIKEKTKHMQYLSHEPSIGEIKTQYEKLQGNIYQPLLEGVTTNGTD